MSNLNYLMAVCAAFAYGAAAFVVEVAVFSVLALFKAVINGAQAIVGWVDDLANDWIPDLPLAENALTRAVIVGLVGFLLWLVLTLLLSLLAGNWALPCSLVFFLGASAFIGVVADPERRIDIGGWPTFRNDHGPKMPINL